YLLAQHPEVEARLHDELDRVLGARILNFADLAELKWTRMVIEEAMRLYPPVHTISRTAIGEDRIGGVRVPPGALISISPYVTHRSPNLWPEPDRFDPERFRPAAAAQRHRFAYLPFGGGPRISSATALRLRRPRSSLRPSRSATGCVSRLATSSNQSGSLRCARREGSGCRSSRVRDAALPEVSDMRLHRVKSGKARTEHIASAIQPKAELVAAR